MLSGRSFANPRLAATSFVAVALITIVGCGGGDDSGTSPEATFPTSLHATGRGMITWYSSASGGFEQITNIPYDQLYCRECHRPLCENCHETPGDSVEQDRCLQCHGLVQLERDANPDVHDAAGMSCMDCHSVREMHGDGTSYSSLLDEGAMDTKCENCHTPLSSNEYHDAHGQTVHCSACHVKGVVTCYVCHFETELEQNRKLSYAQFTDWVFLVNYGGKVHSANFQSVKYREHSFLAMAPFTAHSISKNARACEDCHESTALREYVMSGAVQVTRWDGNTQQIVNLSGVIPVPPDWRNTLKFDFVDLTDAGNWAFMEVGPDKFQMLYGTPLRGEQIDKLRR